MHKGMEALRSLTERLPQFPKPKNGVAEYKEFRMKCGSCFGRTLLMEKEIAIHRWFNSFGTEFPPHQHKCDEWIFVFSGTMALHQEGCEEVRLGEGDCHHNGPGIVHCATFPEDCRYVTVTMPPAEGFPT